MEAADTRVSLDGRMSIEERRGGGQSFDYARRTRQSADIVRTTERLSFESPKYRFSLDPELFQRGPASDPRGNRRGECFGCILV